MSYQIKSTPYFQRMLTKSKRNGELQRLKEEYERIKDFNDHTISLRIRQVRLRRLFREIQDINSSIRPRPRRQPPKTYAQMRAEELARARELGKEYSRENALRMPRIDPFCAASSTSMVSNGRRQLQAKASSTARRLNYGNSMSAYNMKKFQQTQRRSNDRTTSSMQNELNYVSSIELDKVEKLHKCIDYHHSATSITLHDKHNNTDISVVAVYEPPDTKAHVVEIEETEKEAEAETGLDSSSQPDVVKNYTFVLDDDGNVNIDENAFDYIRATNEIDDNDDDEQYVPIAQVLRNAPQLFKNLKECEHAAVEAHHREFLEDVFDSLAEEHEGGENALRKISNDRNLPSSTIRKFVISTNQSTDDAQYIENEQLIKVSKYDDNYLVSHEDDGLEDTNIDPTDREQRKEQSAYEQLKGKTIFYEKPSLKNKPLPAQTKQADEISDFVKLYEPFPQEEKLAQPQPTKENYESGVAKLRSIFEHQGE